MSERVRQMRRESRQDNREERRDDRQDRRALNQRLKGKGMSFLQRRRVIRNKRKLQRVDRRIDRVEDRADRKVVKLQEKRRRIDDRVETPRERRTGQPGRRPAPPVAAPRAAPVLAPRTVVAPVPVRWAPVRRPVVPVVPVAPARWPAAQPPEAAIYARPGLPAPRMLPAAPRALPPVRPMLPPPVRPLLPPPLARRLPLLPQVLEAPPSQPIPVLPSYGPSEEQWEAFEDAYNATYDPIDPNGDDDGVDFNPYDTDELIDVDNGIGPVDMDELYGEISGDLMNFLARPRFSGVEFSGALIEGAVQGIGQAKLNQLAEIAAADGWSRAEYETVAGAIVDTVGSVAAIATASAALLPNLVDKVRERRREGKGLLAAIDDLRDDGKGRRADRAEKRADRAEARAENKGVLNIEDGTWGPAASTENVSVRARLGKRAAIAELPGGFALVRAMEGGESAEAVAAQMRRVLEAARPAAEGAAIAGPLFGCACGCGRCGGRQEV